MNKFIRKIQEKLSPSNDILASFEALSNSELNSFLLELFRLRSQKVSPAELLHQFRNNRFVFPSNLDPLQIKRAEIDYLELAKSKKFKPLTLSPLAPFGSCSAIGQVNQNNVVSALRGTEVVADATNVMALVIADESKTLKDNNAILRYAAVHRHVRGQYFTNPNFTAHFSVFCLASGGSDPGNYEFEMTQMNEHINILLEILRKKFDDVNLFIRLFLKSDSKRFVNILQANNFTWMEKIVDLQEDFAHQYYQTIQFKIFLKTGDQQADRSGRWWYGRLDPKTSAEPETTAIHQRTWSGAPGKIFKRLTRDIWFFV